PRMLEREQVSVGHRHTRQDATHELVGGDGEREDDGEEYRRHHRLHSRADPGPVPETTRTASTLASKRRGSSGCLRTSSRATSIGGSALPSPCSRRTSSPSEVPVIRSVTRSSRSPSGSGVLAGVMAAMRGRPTTAAAAVSRRVTSDGPPAGEGGGAGPTGGAG